MVWDDGVLFDEPIEAWKNGPVVPQLWQATRGSFRVSTIVGSDSALLNSVQRSTISKVLKFYGEKDAQWLSDLTHMEAPWQEASAVGPNTPISLERISEYYSSLAPDEPARSSA